MRKFYSAPCRSYLDQAGYPNRIIWYKAPKDAEIYPHLHAFHPRIDDLDSDDDTFLEFSRLRTNQRKYHVGKNRWETTGDHWHGDEADFLGRSPSAKYRVNGGDPVHPCGGVLIHFADMGVGGVTLHSTGRRVIIGIGVEVGGLVELDAAAFTVGGGIEIGAVSMAA